MTIDKMVRPRSRAVGGVLAFLALIGGLVTVATLSHAADDFDEMRVAWAAQLVGDGTYDTEDPTIAARIELIDDEANRWWDSIDTSPSRTALWSDLTSTTNSAQITEAYTRLRSMAVAAATAGSGLESDAAMIGDVVDALDWMEANRYSATTTEYDNWWDWNIGAPIRLHDTMVLVYDDLTATQVADFTAASLHFTSSVSMTGANRAWLAEVVALAGVLSKNGSMVAAARDGLSPLFDHVTNGNGFYADGSFVQHDSFAYTGGYGIKALVVVADLLELLEGSPWQVVDPDVANVYSWARDAFEPVMYHGIVMDMVRGREISRNYHQDVDAGRSAMEAILRLSGSAAPGHEAELRSMIKEWLLAGADDVFFVQATVPSIALALEILDDSGVAPRGDLLAHNVFGGMDRAAAHGDGWAVGVAMMSSRISNFESINDENQRGWYTGSGYEALYLGDSSYYSDGYWPTIDPYRLPGTTVDVVARSDGSLQNHRNDRDWVGGATLEGRYGAVGMDYADVASSLEAKKSWFTFDDEIVALGAGISSTSGRTIETTVANRRLSTTGDDEVRVNGVLQGTTLSSTEDSLSAVERVFVAGARDGSGVGYFFPDEVTLGEVREARSGAWSDINKRATTPTAVLTRNFQTLWLDHGVSPTDASYAYAILPGASSSEVDRYAAAPEFAVLANTDAAQGVEELGLGIQAVNFWSSGSTTVGAITSSGPASVLLRSDSGEITISVSDPTQLETGSIELDLDLAAVSALELDPRITITRLSPTIQVSIDMSGAAGQSVSARFLVDNKDPWDLLDSGMAP